MTLPTPARALLGVWLALAAGQTVRVAATGSLMSGDGVYHFAHLHSIVVDRDLDPVNEIRYFREEARSAYTGKPKIGNRPPRNPATGEVVNKYPIGLALLVLPVYAAVYAVALALAAVGVPADVSGYGWTYQYACGLLIAAYATAGLWGCQRVVARAGVREDEAWWATLAAAGATPWLFYAVLEPFFSHALSAAAAAAVVWLWLRARESGRAAHWLMTGIAIGVAAMIRYQDAVLLVVPGLDLLTRLRHAPRAAIGHGLALGLGALAGVSPQLAVNDHLFGNPFTTGYFGEGFPYWRSPWLVYTLASADVGLLRWTPIALPAAAGLVLGARRGWPHARAGLVLLALQIYMVSSWFFLSQGHTFGNRMLVNCTVFFAVGIAALVAAARARPELRAALLTLCVLLAGVNVILMGLWSRGLIGPLGRLG
jgi:hypothetical protein